MGIRYLNQYLVRKCNEANKSHFIRRSHLREWQHKCIVVDTSIFLYKFMEKRAFLEHFFLMISTFQKYQIRPVFVFDGKPPPEKKSILLKRRMDRQRADHYLSLHQQYNLLFTRPFSSTSDATMDEEEEEEEEAEEEEEEENNDYVVDQDNDDDDREVEENDDYVEDQEDDDVEENDHENANKKRKQEPGNDPPTYVSREDMEREMRRLERRFVKIKNTDIALLKELLHAYHIPVIQCEGEADPMCAFLVQHRFADACLSDDMDLLLYGCPVVLRRFNVGQDDHITSYHIHPILDEVLHLSLTEFQMLIILSGCTDYFVGSIKYSLEEMMDVYHHHHHHHPSNLRVEQKQKEKEKEKNKPFIQWFLKHKQRENTTMNTMEDFTQIHALFQSSHFFALHKEEIKREVIDQLPLVSLDDTIADLENIRRVLRHDGFLFL